MSGRNASLAIAGLALVALLLYLGLSAVRGERPPLAAPSATASATATPTPSSTTTPAPTATQAAVATPTAAPSGPCREVRYQAGDVPIVAPRLSGQYLQVALDFVRPGRDGNNRWGVRFFVPEGAPGDVVIPLSASVSGPSGPLDMGRYEAAPPNAGAVEVTQPVTLQACSTTAPPGTRGTVLVVAESGPVRSGTYTLTWRDIRLPEGGTRTETWTVTLTCEFDPGPARPQSTLCT
jgi:hypothetical protein